MPKYPLFYLDYKRCINYGFKSVVPISVYNKESRTFDLYPISFLKCKNYNTI